MRSPPSNSSPRAPRGDEPRHSPQGDGGRRRAGPGLEQVDRDLTLLATHYSLPATSIAFTLVEVMMAAVILLVGFMGMIQGLTIGSEMMETARRQTIAGQIIDHEIGQLRLASWSTINAPLSSFTATNYTNLSPHGTQFDAVIAATGVTFNLARTVTSVTTELYEVTFTATWTKSGTTAAASSVTGTWLERLSFSRQSPIARTYTRIGVTYIGKYGLNINL